MYGRVAYALLDVADRLVGNALRLLFEFTAIKYAVLIGTTSFALVAITWVSIWIYLAKEKKIEALKEGTISNEVELQNSQDGSAPVP